MDVLPSSVLAVRFYDSYHGRSAPEQSTRSAHCMDAVREYADCSWRSGGARTRETTEHRRFPCVRVLFLFGSNFRENDIANSTLTETFVTKHLLL